MMRVRLSLRFAFLWIYLISIAIALITIPGASEKVGFGSWSGHWSASRGWPLEHMTVWYDRAINPVSSWSIPRLIANAAFALTLATSLAWLLDFVMRMTLGKRSHPAAANSQAEL